MSKRKRYFVLVSHCLLNPATRVHVLGKRFEIAEKLCSFFLEKKVSIIQLPCPEFTAMGYIRNPQGRQQYDNVFFRKHCKKELQSYVDMINELRNNNNTPLCFVGVGGSPTCSIYWGKHKVNKYKTESIMPVEEEDENKEGVYGVMTEVLDEMLREIDIVIPYLEAPLKDGVNSERTKNFFEELNQLFYKE